MYSYQQTRWVWQNDEWPEFTWNIDRLAPLLRDVRLMQGELLGKFGAVSNDEALVELDNLLRNIITSSAIEGEQLNAESVRSSLARRLGVVSDDPYPVSDRSEGVASIMMDAVSNLEAPLTKERLFQWHAWLFPSNDQSLRPLLLGQLRGHEPMQVVSGRIDRPTVHFEAPPRDVLESELERFIDWFNKTRLDPQIDPFMRAGIAHFWFVTLHPFDDGNGRLTRVVSDLALAQGENRSVRLYAMSATLLERRSRYYEILEKSQQGGVDISDWLVWFLETLGDTFQGALDVIERTAVKTRFWQRFHDAGLLSEQVKVLNRLLDNDFDAGIKASQYASVAKVSKATATRHLVALLEKGCLKRQGIGKSTRYTIQTG